VAAIVIAAIIILAVGIWSAERFYFQPQYQSLLASPSDYYFLSGEGTKTIDDLNVIKGYLQEDKKFNDLQKNGDWPLVAEEIVGPKENPFEAEKSATLAAGKQNQAKELAPEAPVQED